MCAETSQYAASGLSSSISSIGSDMTQRLADRAADTDSTRALLERLTDRELIDSSASSLRTSTEQFRRRVSFQ